VSGKDFLGRKKKQKDFQLILHILSLLRVHLSFDATMQLPWGKDHYAPCWT
jgi:hypothetical protein